MGRDIVGLFGSMIVYYMLGKASINVRNNLPQEDVHWTQSGSIFVRHETSSRDDSVEMAFWLYIGSRKSG